MASPCCRGDFPRMSCDRVLPGGGVPSGSCGGWQPCPGQPACCVPTYRPGPCSSPCKLPCESPVCIPIAYPCPCPAKRPMCCGNTAVNSWPPNYGPPPQNISVNLNAARGKAPGCFCSSPSTNCPRSCTSCGRQGPTINAGCCGKDNCETRSPCVSNGIKYRDGCCPPPCKPCCPKPCCNPLPPCCLTIKPCEPKCCPSRCCKPPPYCCPDPCFPSPLPDPRCCPKPMILSFRCPVPGVPRCKRDPCPQCGPEVRK